MVLQITKAPSIPPEQPPDKLGGRKEEGRKPCQIKKLRHETEQMYFGLHQQFCTQNGPKG